MTAPQVETPGTGATGQAQGQLTEHGSIVAGCDAERTDPFETLRALAALKGHRVHRLDGAGGFIIIGPMGWASRELRDLHALSQALRRMGVV